MYRRFRESVINIMALKSSSQSFGDICNNYYRQYEDGLPFAKSMARAINNNMTKTDE